MYPKYDRVKSGVEQMTDDELDFNLALSRRMMSFFARATRHNNSPEGRKYVITEYKFWYHSWNCTLVEIAKRG